MASSETPPQSDQFADTSQFIDIATKIATQVSNDEPKQQSQSVFERRRISEKFNIIGSRLGPYEHEQRSMRQLKKEKSLSALTKQNVDVLSVSLMQREKQRDTDLQIKLQQLNLKQAARIKEIKEAEERQKDAEIQRVLLSAKKEFNDEVKLQAQQHQQENSKVESGVEEKVLSPKEQITKNAYQKVVKQFMDAGDTRNQEAEKNYFNKNGQPEHKSFDTQGVSFDGLNRSYIHKRINQPHDMTNSTMIHSVSQRTLHQMTTTQSVNWGTRVNRTREDISFLKEMNSLPALTARKVPEPFEKHVSAQMVSNSQITSGDPMKDEYFQVALGLRAIGKSIIDMPRTLEDLRVLSKQYQKNIKSYEQTQDEQIYLSYIEEHYLNTCKHEQDATAQTITKERGISPIRDLQEYYTRMLNKLNISDGVQPARPRFKKSHQHQSAVALHQMTAEDVVNLEKSPPKLNTSRKKMMLIENTIMNQFGNDAFRLPLNNLVKSPNASPMRVREKNLLTKDSAMTAYASKERDVDKRKLLKSLADHGDQLIRPSITPEPENGDKNLPSWMNKSSDFPHLAGGKDLGKPSARQDAVLLAKWFHDIIEVIEQESIKSTFKRQQLQEQNRGRLFANQKATENEVNTLDSYHFVQMVHNIAIKEITRQVSVQCVERGILLKTIFDSYVRLVDLIYSESLNMRRVLAHKFAAIFEKSLQMHQADLERQMKITVERDKQIDDLRAQLAAAEHRERGLRATNKKVVKIAVRNQQLWEMEQKEKAGMELSVQFLENKLTKLQESIDPQRVDMMQKETKRFISKIKRDTIRDYQPSKNGAQAIPVLQDEQTGEKYELKNEDIIREAYKATDMRGFEEHLEFENGGPLRYEVFCEAIVDQYNVQTEPMTFQEKKKFELVKNVQTEVDDQWRRKTRIRRQKRAKSQLNKEIVGILPQIKANDSDCTSTHTALQYRDPDVLSKSFVALTPMNLKVLPVIKKRSLSQGNVNENKLIQKQINKLLKEKQHKLSKAINADPILKLRQLLGEAALKHIGESNGKMFQHILDNALKSKNITQEFCKEIITEITAANAQIFKKAQAEALRSNNKKPAMFRSGGPEQFGSNTTKTMQELHLGAGSKQENYQNYNTKESRGLVSNSKSKVEYHEGKSGPRITVENEEMALMGGEQNTKKGFPASGPKQKSASTKQVRPDLRFKHFNFQRKQAHLQQQSMFPAEHPSVAMTAKVLKKENKAFDKNDLMPAKTLIRIINVVYALRTAELVGGKKKDSKEKRNLTLSLEARSRNLRPSSPDDVISTLSKPRVEITLANKQPLITTGTFTQRSVSKDDVIGQTQYRETQPDNKGTQEPSMVEFVYDYLQQRYGLKKVADKKFHQVICSTLKNQDRSPRIRLFGRFLELYDNLSTKDFKLYVDTQETVQKMVLNFQIQENDERVLVPIKRAEDLFRLQFVQRLTLSSLNNCLRMIRGKAVEVQKADQQKYLHLNNVKEAVTIDQLGELVIKTINQLQAEKIQNIEDLFHAADLSATGIISFDEFRMLYKLIVFQTDETTDGQLAELKKNFDDYAELHDDEDGRKPQRGLDLSAFQKLCLDKEIFTIKAQNEFINRQQKTFLNVTESQSAFELEFTKMKENLDTVYDNLTFAVNEQLADRISEKDKKRYLEMIDQMAKCIMYPVNQKIAFLTFKIVVETIKRAVLKSRIDDYMPVKSATLKELKQEIIDSGTVRNTKTRDIMSKLGSSLIQKVASGNAGGNGGGILKKESSIALDRLRVAVSNIKNLGRLQSSQTSHRFKHENAETHFTRNNEFAQTPQALQKPIQP